tara:strand:+ start:462 stop:2198 length:1737 start_codon:yes stop_codon:yes gene_type:complete
MADRIKQIAFKEFTPSELVAGTPFNVQTGATDAYVIKSIEATQKVDTAEGAVTATATVGLTSDFNNGKYVSLGNVAKQGKTGSTGNIVVDANSTFTVRPTAKSINFKDIHVERLAYVSTSSATQLRQKTPIVNGASEAAESPTTVETTSMGTNFTGVSFTGAVANQFMTFTENTKYTPTKKLAIASSSNGNAAVNLYVSDYDGTTNYLSTGGNWQRRFDFDGRFIYNNWGTTNAGVYDTKAPASVTMANGASQSRALTTGPNHFFLVYKTAAGGAITLGSLGSYPRVVSTYFSDVGKRYLMVSNASNNGLQLFEIPDYDDSDSGGGAWASSNTANVPTTAFYQLGHTSSNQQSNLGPSSNRFNTAFMVSNYTNAATGFSWFIGTSAASTTKRILVFQNGANSTSTNKLYFMLADFDTISTTDANQAGGENEAYTLTKSELASEFGWNTSSGWLDASSAAGYITPNNFVTTTGSAARWDANSRFVLDQDILYFTNRMSHGTGEGPVVAWNLKTNAVTAPISWADYDDTGGTNLANPDNKNWHGHMQYLLTPTTSEINARTYTKAPALTVRISGVHEDRS